MSKILPYIFLLISFLCSATPQLIAQCQNQVLYPGGEIDADLSPGDTVVITTLQHAGDFYNIDQCVIGEAYIFATANPNDYITLRSIDNTVVLASGNNPLSYSINETELSVHINLQNPACGTDGISRESYIYVAEEAPVLPRVGINTDEPLVTLDVQGKLRVSDDENEAVAGSIRWNSEMEDFEGYNGNSWLSLTKPKASWGPVHVEAVNEMQKIAPIDTMFSRFFGRSCKMAGEYAIFGYPSEDNAALVDVGAVYIFKEVNGQYEQHAKLFSPDLQSFMRYGSDIAITDEFMAVGAHGATIGGLTYAGAVYTYRLINDEWVFQERITEPVSAKSNYYGYRVEMHGTRLVVGSPFSAINNVEVGKVYVYNFNNGWIFEGELTSSDALAGTSYANSIDIYENTIIVGAPSYYEGQIFDAGAAYIYSFENGIWGHEQRIVNNFLTAETNFGYSVAIGENYAAISAPNRQNGVNRLDGSVYIYKNGVNWTYDTNIFLNGSSDESSNFGIDVDLQEETLIVGNSSKERNNQALRGEVYIFKNTSGDWIKEINFLASDGLSYDNFGTSVSIHNDKVMVGATGDKLGTYVSAGSAYFFKFSY